jgi:hypothetical protein
MPPLLEGVAGDGSSSDDDGPPEEIHNVLPTAVPTGSGHQLVVTGPDKSGPESVRIARKSNFLWLATDCGIDFSEESAY